jgi:hypothetical protein
MIKILPEQANRGLRPVRIRDRIVLAGTALFSVQSPGQVGCQMAEGRGCRSNHHIMLLTLRKPPDAMMSLRNCVVLKYLVTDRQLHSE